MVMYPIGTQRCPRCKKPYVHSSTYFHMAGSFTMYMAFTDTLTRAPENKGELVKTWKAIWEQHRIMETASAGSNKLHGMARSVVLGPVCWCFDWTGINRHLLE